MQLIFFHCTPYTLHCICTGCKGSSEESFWPWENNHIPEIFFYVFTSVYYICCFNAYFFRTKHPRANSGNLQQRKSVQWAGPSLKRGEKMCLFHPLPIFVWKCLIFSAIALRKQCMKLQNGADDVSRAGGFGICVPTAVFNTGLQWPTQNPAQIPHWLSTCSCGQEQLSNGYTNQNSSRAVKIASPWWPPPRALVPIR